MPTGWYNDGTSGHLLGFGSRSTFCLHVLDTATNQSGLVLTASLRALLTGLTKGGRKGAVFLGARSRNFNGKRKIGGPHNLQVQPFCIIFTPSSKISLHGPGDNIQTGIFTTTDSSSSLHKFLLSF